MPAIIPKWNLLEKYVTAEKLKGFQEQRSRNKLLDSREGVRFGREGTRFQREGQQFEQEMQKGKLEIDQIKFQTVEQLTDSIKKNLQYINWSNYAKSRDYLIKLGADEFVQGTLLPEPADFMKTKEAMEKDGKKISIEEVFEKFKADILTPALSDLDMQIKRKQGGLPIKGEIRDFQEGAETVTEEFKGEEWGPKAKGPKWDPSKGKGKDDEFKIRKELANVEKARKALEKTGGIGDVLFTLLSQSNPDKAAKLKGSPDEVKVYLEEWEKWLRSQLLGGEATPSGKTGDYEYIDGKLIKIQ